MALRLRRGTDVQRQAIIPLEGELLYTTDTKELYVGDGTTLGGILVSAEVGDDTSPVLGGNLDLNGNNIVGTGNINIDGTITATGNINLGDGAEDNVIVGGQIGSSLIPKVSDSYDLGAAAGRWNKIHAFNGVFGGDVEVGNLVTDGNIVKSDSTVIYDAVTDSLTVSSVTSNFTGSVFSDDSSILVDAISQELHTTTLRSLNVSTGFINNPIYVGSDDLGSGLHVYSDTDTSVAIEGVTSGGETANFRTLTSRGTLDSKLPIQTGDQVAGIIGAGWDGTDWQACGGMVIYASNVGGGQIDGGAGFVIPKAGTGGTEFWENSFGADGTLNIPGNIVTPTISSDLTGSVYGAGSTMLVDAVNNTIPGYISIATLQAAVNDGAGDFAAFKAYILGL